MNKVTLKIRYLDNNEERIFTGSSKDDVIDKCCRATGVANGMRPPDLRIKFRPYTTVP